VGLEAEGDWESTPLPVLLIPLEPMLEQLLNKKIARMAERFFMTYLH
jgi:hypothetical protein